MRIGALVLASLACSMAWALASAPVLAGKPTPAEAEEVAYQEAEILIYLLPVAKETRARGSDISWESWEGEPGSNINYSDYFVFWVVDARPNPYGSNTIGYFAVNKHTADVRQWGGAETGLVTSPELEGVQKILRKAHHIDQRTVQKYRSRPVDAPSKRAPPP